MWVIICNTGEIIIINQEKKPKIYKGTLVKKMHSFRLTEKAANNLRHLQEIYEIITKTTISLTRVIELLIYQEMRRVNTETDEKFLKKLLKEK